MQAYLIKKSKQDIQTCRGRHRTYDNVQFYPVEDKTTFFICWWGFFTSWNFINIVSKNQDELKVLQNKIQTIPKSIFIKLLFKT